jgi:CheY-like chemotaxis protein
MDLAMAAILLIEDNAIVQHVHKLIFNKLGHTVEVADSGLSALEILKNKPAYDIIFVDIGLPDIHGFDLIKEVRESFISDPNYPIIALTGYIGENEKKACLAAGATEVLHKPILLNVMSDTLKRYL